MNNGFSTIATNYIEAEAALDALLNKGGAIDFDELVKQAQMKNEAMDKLEQAALDFYESSGKALESFTDDGRRWIMTPSLRCQGSIQLTYFSKEGLPFGDMQFNDPIQAIQELFRSTSLSNIRNHDGSKFFHYEANTNSFNPATPA